MLEDEVGWRVGFGSKISVWTDRWLPKWARGKIHNTVITDSVDQVFDLIALNPKRWNEEDERLIWAGDRTSEYTIRSGYRTLIGQLLQTVMLLIQ
ncbi:hypothetical protein Gogos_006625 [Gossypium gossypioides]|uniref:Uncharacterized protein n=1 Tax=Gossypium gossypioides TaxID=34282 RepID=A0A7J9C6B9_GOSGO|nr:hypothetical protein [Gossypium gossypioides]